MGRFTPPDDRMVFALGRAPGRVPVAKFGRIALAGTTEKIVATTSSGADYAGCISVAEAVRIKLGGNAADDAGGTGARTIIVEGLDAALALVSETITTNGTSVSTSTTIEFLRVFRAYADDAGSGKVNAGDIVVETDSGIEMAYIAAGYGQTQQAVYTVPAGKRVVFTGFTIDPEGGKSVTVRIYQQQDISNQVAPFKSKRLVKEYPELSAPFVLNLPVWGAFPAGTDLWFTATTTSGTSACTCEAYFYLVDDD